MSAGTSSHGMFSRAYFMSSETSTGLSSEVSSAFQRIPFWQRNTITPSIAAVDSIPLAPLIVQNIPPPDGVLTRGKSDSRNPAPSPFSSIAAANSLPSARTEKSDF